MATAVAVAPASPRFVSLDALGFLLLYGQIGAAIFVIPDSPLRHLREPVYNAALSDVAFVLFITAVRLWKGRGTRLERFAFGVFLGSMPLVYVSSWFFAAAPAPSLQLWIELGGVAIFGALAVVGVARAPWLLPIGILAHGLLWDLWHHGAVGRATTFMPDWYALGCLIADVAMAAYAAIQVPAWRQVSEARATSR